MSDSSASPAAPANRKIIHCDCDCFYASIEMRDDPRLRGRPLAVGGRPEGRGVVATCNYEARHFGIHSAMPMAHAMRLCPELIVIPPAMDKYRIASGLIQAIMLDYSDLMEPLSLDEAYLDVSGSDHHQGSATLIAREIRARVFEQVGITVSAGVAPNKFLAKIASDWNKPDGMFVVRPVDVAGFVSQLPVKKLHGVGKVTAARMNSLGIETCADLQTWTVEALTREFGSFGERLHQLSHGIDDREVNPTRERKSISVETTYVRDLRSFDACRAEMAALLAQLRTRIARAEAGDTMHKLFVKLRFADFSRTTAECVAHSIAPAQVERLLREAHGRNNKAVRLMGVGIRLGPPVTQYELFQEAVDIPESAVDETADEAARSEDTGQEDQGRDAAEQNAEPGDAQT
jgi:DNA polymerase-4